MIIIGEKINASRKSIRQAIADKDAEAIRKQIRAQDQAGSDYIDLNAGTGAGDQEQEISDLCWLIDLALETTEKKLVLDAGNPEVISRAAKHLENRRPWMLNSIKADEDLMVSGLALAAEYDVPVVALAMDEKGIPETSERRIENSERIVAAAHEAGVSTGQLFFDPLALPISADITQAQVTFQTIRGIKERFPDAHTTMGLSNVSFGLTKRAQVNGAFLATAIVLGLDSAICDPTRPSVMKAIRLGELLAGQDRYCRRFTRAVRKGLFDPKK